MAMVDERLSHKPSATAAMRLGIKGKQVLGVTSIVGVVVVIAEPAAPGAAGERQPRREPRARGAARQRDLPPRARRSSARGAGSATRRCATTPACGRSSSRASTPRTSRSPRSSTSTGVAVAHADPSLEGQTLPVGGDLGELLARSPLVAAARHLFGPGTEPRVPAAAAARRHRVRVDPDRRLDAARSGRTWTARCGPAIATALRRARPWRCSARCCWRSCCCGRFT